MEKDVLVVEFLRQLALMVGDAGGAGFNFPMWPPFPSQDLAFQLAERSVLRP